jgi:hypothetical protein
MFWAHIQPIIKRLPVQCGSDDCLLRPRSHVPVFDWPEADRTGVNTTLKFIPPHSRFPVFDRHQVLIIDGHSSGTQERTGVFTQLGHFASQEKTGVSELVYKQHMHHC